MTDTVPQQAHHKNVCVGSMSYEYVNIYSIGMNIPTLYDFPAYHKSFLELCDDEGNKNLIEHHKQLSAYGLTIEELNSQFDKYEILPDSLWISNNEKEQPKDDELIFRVKGGGIILREKYFNVIKHFSLGQTTLTPLNIYELETGKLWKDEVFYFLNLCEHRKYVCHSQSNPIFIYMKGANRYSTQGVPIKNDQLEISKSALSCEVDLWHDPMIASSIFMSDRLYSSLDELNIIYQWNMKSCNLI